MAKSFELVTRGEPGCAYAYIAKVSFEISTFKKELVTLEGPVLKIEAVLGNRSGTRRW